VIALVYDFTSLSSTRTIDSIQWHTGGDMIAFVSESTHLVIIIIIIIIIIIKLLFDAYESTGTN